MKILIVEDETVIAEGICAFLEKVGYECLVALDGELAVEYFETQKIDLILLDVMLPKKSGLEVLKEIRKESNIPILMLTALSDDQTQITAFSNLADGYINKPFSLPVLKARIDNLLKKNYYTEEIWCHSDTVVNLKKYTAKIGDKEIKVNPKEIDILKMLIEHEDQALSRGQIIDYVWKESDEIPFDRVVDVYIKELRKKLNLDCIKTVKNIGYKLEGVNKK